LKIATALCWRGCSETAAVTVAGEVLALIGAASPQEVIDEGMELLGATVLWSDLDKSKATEHMVRRITAADQVVRGRLERENAELKRDLRNVRENLERAGDFT
jgi:hypothetical protein